MYICVVQQSNKKKSQHSEKKEKSDVTLVTQPHLQFPF